MAAVLDDMALVWLEQFADLIQAADRGDVIVCAPDQLCGHRQRAGVPVELGSVEQRKVLQRLEEGVDRAFVSVGVTDHGGQCGGAIRVRDIVSQMLIENATSRVSGDDVGRDVVAQHQFLDHPLAAEAGRPYQGQGGGLSTCWLTYAIAISAPIDVPTTWRGARSSRCSINSLSWRTNNAWSYRATMRSE